MKIDRYSKVVGLSLVTAMLLGSSAYAAKLIGVNPNDTVVQNKQFGFGGWDLENVAVKIVSTEDFTTETGTFNPVDGTYTTMTDGDSFESEISTGGEVRGHLHGKDWPVGEPSGIKILNGDTQTSHGKPENCIITTSFLEDIKNPPTYTNGFLDAFVDGDASTTPSPTLCSSEFQTHKRFKINMLPSSVEGIALGAYAKPIDLVFKLDPNDTNTSIQRYQIFQKINNYTGMRLDGYKVEVLDANNKPNPNLTISLGIGEDITKDGNASDIWDTEDMANFSHGLWGPQTYEDPPHFPTDGFFDDTRVYFPVQLTSSSQMAYSTNGAIQGGNYDALFGHWLPSIWQPIAIFHDDDNNPNTDAALIAYWGIAPTEPADATPNWHKGFADNFAVPTQEEIDELLSSDGVFFAGLIEDTLNLGLNYIVEVGDNTGDQIGDTFTLRITPHLSTDQTPPSYIDENGDYILPPQLIPPVVDPTPPGVDPTPPPVVPPYYPGGGGGGCTYNPNSNSFDMTFLFMMALGLLYPFRRRFLK